jgi:hypothetical protein
MSLFDVFFGTTQSQYSAYAILAAIVAICLTVLFSKTDMSYGNRFLLILFILLSQIPFIFLVLFEITCIVTGGDKNERWWCWLFAWVIAVFIIIYCILIIIISLSSLMTYNNAIDKVDVVETKERMTIDNSNDYAMQLMETSNKNINELFTNMEEPTSLSSVVAQSTPNLEMPDMNVTTTPPPQQRVISEEEKDTEPEGFMNMHEKIQKFKNMRNGGSVVNETFETMDNGTNMMKMEEEEIETFENKYFSPLLGASNKSKGENKVEGFESLKNTFASIF